MLAKTLITLLTVSTLLAISGVAKADVEIQTNNTRMSVGGGRVEIQKNPEVATVSRYPVYYDWKTRSLRILPGSRTAQVVRSRTGMRCQQDGYYQERYHSRSSGNSNVQVYSSSSTTVCR